MTIPVVAGVVAPPMIIDIRSLAANATELELSQNVPAPALAVTVITTLVFTPFIRNVRVLLEPPCAAVVLIQKFLNVPAMGTTT